MYVHEGGSRMINSPQNEWESEKNYEHAAKIKKIRTIQFRYARAGNFLSRCFGAFNIFIVLHII